MNIREATEICGTLGYPSKMPGTSYGIPAQACIIGSKLRDVKGSTCEKCYAFERNNYKFRDVKKSQATRLMSLDDPLWVDAMVTLLIAAHIGMNRKTRRAFKKLPWFHRWHDSGDLQSRDHLAKICAVARATPWLQHWLPTREAKIVKDFVRDGGSIPSNLTIRLSATMVDGAAPKAWPLTSTVHDKSSGNGHRCPAPQQGNKCGSCRACWSKDVTNVSYHIH
jgi:hypothetical protein